MKSRAIWDHGLWGTGKGCNNPAGVWLEVGTDVTDSYEALDIVLEGTPPISPLNNSQCF